MDGALLPGFRRGDREVLSTLYRAHVDEVERLIRRGLLAIGRFSAANVADLVQDVFLKAFSAPVRLSYDGERPYAPFLMTITRNVFVDWARRTARERQREPAVEAALAEAAALSGEDPAPFPATSVAITQRYVARLSPELRAVHTQRFVLSEPQRRAAAVLGISRQRLRTLERKLVEGLRQELASAGEAQERDSGALRAMPLSAESGSFSGELASQTSGHERRR